MTIKERIALARKAHSKTATAADKAALKKAEEWLKTMWDIDKWLVWKSNKKEEGKQALKKKSNKKEAEEEPVFKKKSKGRTSWSWKKQKEDKKEDAKSNREKMQKDLWLEFDKDWKQKKKNKKEMWPKTATETYIDQVKNKKPIDRSAEIAAISKYMKDSMLKISSRVKAKKEKAKKK